jgi:hypothetical protein
MHAMWLVIMEKRLLTGLRGWLGSGLRGWLGSGLRGWLGSGLRGPTGFGSVGGGGWLVGGGVGGGEAGFYAEFVAVGVLHDGVGLQVGEHGGAQAF